MRRRATGLLLLVSVFVDPSPAAAQQDADLTVGDRVRVQTLNAGVVIGVLEGVGRDFLEVNVEHGTDVRTWSLELDSLEKVQVHRGTFKPRKRGALIGLGAGVLFGMIHGSSTSLCNHCSGSAAGVEMVVFGVLGTVGGALLGGVVRIDRWQTVELDALRVVSGRAGDGGVGLGASMRW